MNMDRSIPSQLVMWTFLACFLLFCKALAQDNHYYCIDGQTQEITGVSSGFIITRVNGSAFYGNNMRCSWKLDVGAERRVQVSVVTMDLQWSPTYTTCDGYDSMDVWEGDTKKGFEWLSICHARNPHSLVTKGRYLYMTFTTTPQNFADKPGIELKFEAFDNSTCPPGWFQSPDGNDICLMIEEQGTVAWDRAQDICHYNKGNLASIGSEAEYQAVLDKGVNITEAWIGLHDIDGNGAFVWVDKQSLSYNREITERRYDYHCVVQNSKSGEWVAKQCDNDKHNYVCKAKKDGSSVLYSAETTLAPPEQESGGVKVYLVVIFACVLAGVLMLVTVGLMIYYRKHGRCPWTKRLRAKPQTTREEPGTSTGFSTVGATQDRARATGGAARETVLLSDSQAVAPPTYADSKYDRIVRL